MDYEKAFDRAKSAYGTGAYDDATLEFIFPELHESEDERIRKGLIEALKASKTVGELKFVIPEPTRKECIAYLEKQKECVIDNIKTSTDDDERIRKALVDFFDSALGKDLLQRKCGLNPDAVLAWFEKQKINTEGDFGRGYDCGYKACLNSHGAEWFEKQKHPNGCFTCDEYKKGYEEGRRNGFTAGYNKAMKEVEQKEQKPMEIHIDNPNIEKFDPDVKVTTSDSSASGKELLYVCNKSYKIGYRDGVNSVKQEWSEEDEKMLELVIANYEYMFDKLRKGDDSDGIPDHILIMDWLKSLRSRPKSSDNWKPSEEQMAALYTAAREGPIIKENGNFLYDLYDQLKKLNDDNNR